MRSETHALKMQQGTYLAGVDEQRNTRRLKFLEVLWYIEQRRVGNDSSLDDFVERKIKDVASAKAVARSTKDRNTLLLECSDDFVERRPGLLRPVLGQPGREIKLEWAVFQCRSGLDRGTVGSYSSVQLSYRIAIQVIRQVSLRYFSIKTWV